MFILVPIGHERTQVRRLPAVSLVLLGLNVVFFLLTYIPQGASHDREVERHLSGVFDYLEERPYLEPSPELLATLLSDEQRRHLQRMLADLRRAVAPPLAEQIAREQLHLDGLCRDAVSALGSSFIHRLGYTPARPRLHTLFTAMFVHAGWLHFLFNMLFFYLTAPFVEDVYGRATFAAFYLLSGVAATLVHAAHFPTSPVPLVGASGAIAGLMGAFLIRFYRTRIRFFYIFFGLYFLFFLRFGSIWRRLTGTFWAPAYIMLPLWLLQQWASAVAAGEAAGVAFWAHVGGFFFGALVAAALALGRIEEQLIAPGIDRQLTLERPRGLVEAVAEMEAGRPRQARAWLQRALASAPADPDIHLELYRVSLALGDEPSARSHAARHVALEAAAGRGESALATWSEATARWPDMPFHALALLNLGRLAARTDPAAGRAVLEMLAAQHPGDGVTAKGLALLAHQSEIRGDGGEAVTLLARAIAVAGIDDDLRRALEIRIREVAAAAGVPLPELPRRAPRGVAPPVAGPPRRRSATG